MSPADRDRVAQAIAAAERGTTGRIAVRVIKHATRDAFEHAKKEFERRGMHRHQHGNAALILVSPNARKFAVIGDAALHERVGDAFWQRIVDEMRDRFANGTIADGVVAGIERIGEAFRAHFTHGEVGS